MKLHLDKRYYSIYLVGAIIAACFIFMIGSSVAVMKTIGGGKTSADLALRAAEKECGRRGGELVQQNPNNPLYTQCIVDAGTNGGGQP